MIDRKRSSCLSGTFAILFCLVAGAAWAAAETGETEKTAETRKLPVLKTHPVGSLPLRKIFAIHKTAPGGIVSTQDVLASLWKSWGLDSAKRPKVDFEKHLLYVVDRTYTSGGDTHAFQVDAKGTLSIRYIGGPLSSIINLEKPKTTGRVDLLLLDRKGVVAVMAMVASDKEGTRTLTPTIVPVPTEGGMRPVLVE